MQENAKRVHGLKKFPGGNVAVIYFNWVYLKNSLKTPFLTQKTPKTPPGVLYRASSERKTENIFGLRCHIKVFFFGSSNDFEQNGTIGGVRFWHVKMGHIGRCTDSPDFPAFLTLLEIRGPVLTRIFCPEIVQGHLEMRPKRPLECRTEQIRHRPGPNPSKKSGFRPAASTRFKTRLQPLYAPGSHTSEGFPKCPISWEVLKKPPKTPRKKNGSRNVLFLGHFFFSEQKNRVVAGRVRQGSRFWQITILGNSFFQTITTVRRETPRLTRPKKPSIFEMPQK